MKIFVMIFRKLCLLPHQSIVPSTADQRIFSGLLILVVLLDLIAIDLPLQLDYRGSEKPNGIIDVSGKEKQR